MTPEPSAFDWTPAPAPVHAAIVASGGRVLPLTRAWHELAHATRAAPPLHRTVRGHR
jgi:hypothetical protein